jgi:hypothetical protein
MFLICSASLMATSEIFPQLNCWSLMKISYHHRIDVLNLRYQLPLQHWMYVVWSKSIQPRAGKNKLSNLWCYSPNPLQSRPFIHHALILAVLPLSEALLELTVRKVLVSILWPASNLKETEVSEVWTFSQRWRLIFRSCGFWYLVVWQLGSVLRRTILAPSEAWRSFVGSCGI